MICRLQRIRTLWATCFAARAVDNGSSLGALLLITHRVIVRYARGVKGGRRRIPPLVRGRIPWSQRNISLRGTAQRPRKLTWYRLPMRTTHHIRHLVKNNSHQPASLRARSPWIPTQANLLLHGVHPLQDVTVDHEGWPTPLAGEGHPFGHCF
ncbi:hypothetical protein OH77DRAFT_52040 [Trametes cingulata]|nr:hypothetical protein OH77DRAFT_52040 [Trametes cingulata]